LAVRCFKRAFRWSETTDRSVGRCVGSNAFGRLTVAGVSRCVMSV
jgi:Ca2+/Na+ antiporter